MEFGVGNLRSKIDEYYTNHDFVGLEGFLRETAATLEAQSPRRPALAVVRNELGALCRSQGRYAESEQEFLKAADTFETEKEINGDYAATVNNLADTYRLMRQYEKAEALYRHALESYASTVGKNDMLYAAGLNNLAFMYQDMEEFDKAIPLYHEALDIVRAQPDCAVEYATNLNNLAAAYMEHAQYDKAEPLLAEAAEVFRKNAFEAHPYYAMVLNSLAVIYLSRKDYDGALPLFETALRHFEAIFGSRRAECAGVDFNIGLIHFMRDNYADAEAYFGRAAKIYQLLFGPQSPACEKSLEYQRLSQQKQ